MVNFNNLGTLRHLNCADCGQEFTTHLKDETVCTQCHFYRTNPDMAPKYWTWTRFGNNQWGVTAFWPENEDLPKPGDPITVHRKDGSTSSHTIQEIRNSAFTPEARFRATCLVN